MRDVIEKIIATEGEAKSAIDAARAEADTILSDAQKKGRDILERARKEAQDEADKILETKVGAAEQEKQNLLAKAVTDIESQIVLDPETRKQAVDWIVRCICSQQ